MAAERPLVTPGALGEVLGRLPPRIRRRLDADPRAAEAWDWEFDASRLLVRAHDATVTANLIGGVVRTANDVVCTCLLAPRCLHVAAVLSVLGLAEAGEHHDRGSPATGRAADAPDFGVFVEPANRLADALGRLLEVGAGSAGVLTRGEVLRAVHSCQLVGLHRLGAAGLRVARNVGLLDADRPEFQLADLSRDIAESLILARRIAAGQHSPDLIGTARREYEAVGALRLFGIFSEPVIARSGYGGCATYFCDSNGQIWVLSDVRPGPPERATEAYEGPLGIGDSYLSHREASRSGLIVENASASLDGRLGKGQRVRAVTAAGAAWDAEPLAALFSPRLDEQLDRVWAGDEEPELTRRQGSSLVFIRCRIVRLEASGLVVDADGAELLLVAPSDHETLHYRSNLESFAGRIDAEILAVGRPDRDRPSTVEVLACGAPAAGVFSLPASFGGRVNLGFDALPHAGGGTLPAGASRKQRRPAIDPLEPLSRRLDRLVLGGRLTLGTATKSAVAAEAMTMRDRQMGGGAEVLVELARRAGDRSTSSELADAWLAADLYRRAARRVLGTVTWRAS